MQPPEDLLRTFAVAPDELDTALAGLTESQLDLARLPGEWTTREIVHHLADGEAHWLTCIKMALLSPGSVYRHNQWAQDTSTKMLGYGRREIAPSLALFRAQRLHIVQLVSELDAAWERDVLFDPPDASDERRRVPVSDIVKMEIRHAGEHIAEIRKNRSVNGL